MSDDAIGSLIVGIIVVVVGAIVTFVLSGIFSARKEKNQLIKDAS